METPVHINPPPRHKLQVAVYSNSTVPFRRFLHLTDPSNSVDTLTSQIQERFHKIYPLAPPLAIDRVQDGNDCDLDPSYIVDDVFTNGSQVKIFVNGEYEVSMNRSPQTIATAAGPQLFQTHGYRTSPSGGLVTPTESESRRRQKSLSLGVSPGTLKSAHPLFRKNESNVKGLYDQKKKKKGINADSIRVASESRYDTARPVNISTKDPIQTRTNNIPNKVDSQAKQSQSVEPQATQQVLNTPIITNKSQTILSTVKTKPINDAPISKKRKLNNMKETLVVLETSPPRPESHRSILNASESHPQESNNAQPLAGTIPKFNARKVSGKSGLPNKPIFQNLVNSGQVQDISSTLQKYSLLSTSHNPTEDIDPPVSKKRKKTKKAKKESLTVRETSPGEAKQHKTTVNSHPSSVPSAHEAAKLAAKELSAASEAALDAFRAFDMSCIPSQPARPLVKQISASTERRNVYSKVSEMKKSTRKNSNIKNSCTIKGSDHLKNVGNGTELRAVEEPPTRHFETSRNPFLSSQTDQLHVHNSETQLTEDSSRPALKNKRPAKRKAPDQCETQGLSANTETGSELNMNPEKGKQVENENELIVPMVNQSELITESVMVATLTTGKKPKKNRAATKKDGKEVLNGLEDPSHHESPLPEIEKTVGQAKKQRSMSSSKEFVVRSATRSSRSSKRRDIKEVEVPPTPEAHDEEMEDAVPLTQIVLLSPTQPSFDIDQMIDSQPQNVFPSMRILEQDQRQYSPSSSSFSDEHCNSVHIVEQREEEGNVEMQQILKSPPRTNNSSDSQDETVSPAPSSRNSSISEDNSGSESLIDDDNDSTASEDEDVEPLETDVVNGIIGTQEIPIDKDENLQEEQNELKSLSAEAEILQSSQPRSQFYKSLSEISRAFTPTVRDSRIPSQKIINREEEAESSENTSSSSDSDDESSSPKKNKRHPLLSLFKGKF